MIKNLFAGCEPVTRNILLHYNRWKLSTLNPLAPADVLRQLIFKVDKLENWRKEND